MCVDEESTEVAIRLSVADIEFLQEKANKSARKLEDFIADIIESYIKAVSYTHLTLPTKA